ncbi:MAG: polysaccharide biosynthesis/export family protein, partial [Gemmatimonadales bacterium]
MAQEILQTNPELARQLRERIAASGLTPTQIRARLRAAGYPDTFLDDYLSGADTTRAVNPGSNTLEALRSLGIIGPEETDSLRLLTDSTRHLADSLRADSLTDTTTTLKLFGLDIFHRSTSRFAADLRGPVDANYRLGPGDELVLILTGDVEVASTLDINREGFVVIPQVGQLYVANLSLSQLENLLYTRLGRVYSGVRRGSGATTRFQV